MGKVIQTNKTTGKVTAIFNNPLQAANLMEANRIVVIGQLEHGYAHIFSSYEYRWATKEEECYCGCRISTPK